MDTYNTDKMKQGAQDILAELKTYTTQREVIETNMNNLTKNWNDSTQKKYDQKYKREAKVAAENIEILMKQYAELLRQAAEKYEELHRNMPID